jgi:hypothetical protein
MDIRAIPTTNPVVTCRRLDQGARTSIKWRARNEHHMNASNCLEFDVAGDILTHFRRLNLSFTENEKGFRMSLHRHRKRLGYNGRALLQEV